MTAFLGRSPLLSVACLLAVGLLVPRAGAQGPAGAVRPEIARMVETAKTASGQDRYVAIDDLGERHESPSTVVPVLQALLGEQDPQVKWRSARALGDYKELAAGAAPELRGLLKHEDPIVRYHGATALGKVGDRSDETVQALVRAMTGDDGRVARASIAALRELQPGPDHVLAALENVLKSDDEAVLLYAIEALVAQGAAAAPLLNDALARPETALLACTAIEQIGPDAKETVPALTKLLGETQHSQVQIEALLALASIGPGAVSAAPAVEALLDKSADATVPVAAAYALGAIGGKDADDELKEALESKNEFLQMVAAWSLAKLHPGDRDAMERAVEMLTKGLGSDDEQLRTAAAHGMQKLGAPPEMVAPRLAALAHDPNPDVVANVETALASLGDSIVPHAARALENPELRGLAIAVLRKLGPKGADAAGALTEAAKGAEADEQAAILITLGAIGPGAAGATDVAVAALESDDDHLRHSALFALRQFGPGARGALPALVKMLGAADEIDALAAGWAIASIAPQNGDATEKALPVLQRGLAHRDERARLQTVETLMILGPAAADAKEALAKMAKEDQSEAVRETAALAVEELSKN